jgi:hypothetical protein
LAQVHSLRRNGLFPGYSRTTGPSLSTRAAKGAQEWQEKQKRKSTAKVGFIRTSQEPPPRLSQDTDHNGASEAGELHTLADLGVTTISLDYREARRRDRYGNRFRYRAKVAGPNGGDLGSWAYDVFLVMLP